jgi:hypothetical protein
MSQIKHHAPLEIRCREIALQFLKDGRFDRVERKFYCLSEYVDDRYVVLLDRELALKELDRAGHLWGKHTQQWTAIKRAMGLTGWTDPTYANYGWRWSADEYRNSDNVFLRWIYRTSTGCESVDFKCSSQTKTIRNTQYYLLYV